MKLAVFYHTCINFNRDHGINIIAAQMSALKSSGLMDACDQMIVGVNGDDTDVAVVESLLPSKAVTFKNAPDTWPSGEVPTINYLHEWLMGYDNYHVMYHHMKGLSYPPGSGLHDQMSNWRWCMQQHVIERWRECVAYLDSGYDACGVHYHTPDTYPGPGHVPFFAGNFWWATSRFLSTLPRISVEGHLAGGRYEAEAWLGRGKVWAKAKDMKGVSVWQCNH